MGRDSEGVIRAAGGITFTVRFDLTLGSIETDQQIKEYNYIRFIDGYTLRTSAANRLIGEVVQSRRRPLLGPSPG